MTNTFKVGDLLIWTETAWAKHIDHKNNTAQGFVYSMPPAGFYKIVDIDYDGGLTYYVQSLENSRYEKSLDELNFAKNFQLASEKYQEDSELISALDIIGLL
jgi:hypothetical protein